MVRQRTSLLLTSRNTHLQRHSCKALALEHVVRPSAQSSDNSYHYLVLHVDGTRFRVEVIGVDARPGFHPYGSHLADLSDIE